MLFEGISISIGGRINAIDGNDARMLRHFASSERFRSLSESLQEGRDELLKYGKFFNKCSQHRSASVLGMTRPILLYVMLLFVVHPEIFCHKEMGRKKHINIKHTRLCANINISLFVKSSI